jgi:hypothetical protein
MIKQRELYSRELEYEREIPAWKTIWIIADVILVRFSRQ